MTAHQKLTGCSENPLILSIIIVNWNSGSQLATCIASISQAAASLDDEWEVIVVDNASSDDSLSRIPELSGRLKLLRNTQNRGFAAACNQGAILAQGHYLLFLNPDTRLFADSLEKPISFMKAQASSGIGICGIRLLDDAGNTSTCASRFPGLRIMIGSLLGLSVYLPQLFPSHLMRPTELETNRPVDQVTGAYFLVRRHVYDACGGFDERFFVYYEEVDFSLRALQKGFASYLLADVAAFHRGGGCSEQVKAMRLFYSLRSRIQYAGKHFSLSDRAGLWLVMAIEFPARIVRGIIHLSPSEAKDTVAAYLLLARYYLQKRR